MATLPLRRCADIHAPNSPALDVAILSSMMFIGDDTTMRDVPAIGKRGSSDAYG
jgi:hypothetical protein